MLSKVTTSLPHQDMVSFPLQLNLRRLIIALTITVCQKQHMNYESRSPKRHQLLPSSLRTCTLGKDSYHVRRAATVRWTYWRSYKEAPKSTVPAVSSLQPHPAWQQTLRSHLRSSKPDNHPLCYPWVTSIMLWWVKELFPESCQNSWPTKFVSISNGYFTLISLGSLLCGNSNLNIN